MYIVVAGDFNVHVYLSASLRTILSAFVAYMDGEAVEDHNFWCPGVICAKPNPLSDPASSLSATSSVERSPSPDGKPGDNDRISPSLVVDVLGKAQAEFEVNKDNLTWFPGSEDNLETVQDAVMDGLVGFELSSKACIWQRWIRMG